MDLNSGIYIPQDILSCVTEQLQYDTSSILKLCLVSHGFCYEARGFLYRRIRVVNSAVYRITPHDPHTVNFDVFTRFLTTVIRNPHLGLYVREFHYSPENRSRPIKFWALMNQSLHHMVNLKVFSFLCFVSPPKRSLFWGTKFQLEEFYWEDGYRIDRDGEIIQFLRTQPELRVLAAPLSNPQLRPSLPKLQTFVGDTDSIKQLLSNQPVEKLRWRGHPPEKSSAYLDLLSSLTSLRVLSIGASNPRSGPWLPILAPLLTTLELLHLTGLHDSREDEYEFRQIPNLKNLRVLMWSPASFHVKPYTKPDQRHLVESWFNKSKKLEMVYFWDQEQIGRDSFWRWDRGNLSPVLHSWKEVAERESIQEFIPLLDSSHSRLISMF